MPPEAAHAGDVLTRRLYLPRWSPPGPGWSRHPEERSPRPLTSTAPPERRCVPPGRRSPCARGLGAELPGPLCLQVGQTGVQAWARVSASSPTRWTRATASEWRERSTPASPPRVALEHRASAAPWEVCSRRCGHAAGQQPSGSASGRGGGKAGTALRCPLSQGLYK